MDNNATVTRNLYGFVGIQYLSDKYNRTPFEIMELFIDNDYSISRTVEHLELMAMVA